VRISLVALALLGGMAVRSAAAEEVVTYTKDIAPILWKHCAECHRPGQVAPFALLTYHEAAKRARHIKQITASRRMPPWKPEPGCGEFIGARRLSDHDIRLLARWADSGAKEGDPKDLPAAPTFSHGWPLGPPDLVLKMSEPFTVPAGGGDVYRCFVLPTNLTEDKSVAAVDIKPGNRKVVHHVNVYVDTKGKARKLDSADPGPGYASFGSPGFPVAGRLGGWAPGAVLTPFPPGTGKPLPKGSDIVLQIHYHQTGKAETDQSTVGVYFTKGPAPKLVRGIMLAATTNAPRGINPIRIPPGEKHHRIYAWLTVPVDVHALGVAPHMHYLGREMKVTATFPDGHLTTLIWIKDWDFNWQGLYRYKQPIALPKGTKIEMEAFFDNSADNPMNPNNPPKLVHGGNRTTDEMCQCAIQVLLDRDEDALTFRREMAKLSPFARKKRKY
jgi:mono/diheme cytochrome c family protein